MKIYGFLILICGLTFCNCNNENKKSTTTDNTKDKEEIQNLIKQVLAWADSKNCIEILPVVTDSNDSIYLGFDLEKHKLNLNKLKSTGLFSTEFIENYNQIILTLDKGLKNSEYEQWLVGDLPTFIFANDINPWCLCQDNLDWWKNVEVKVISLDNEKGELEWFWGNLSNDTDSSWKEFKYRFRVAKEKNIWKISYLEGFDFKESTRKDGQL